MIWLHKILPALVSPLALTIFLLLLSVFTSRIWPIMLAIVVLLIASNPLVPRMGFQYLEKDQMLRPHSEVEQANAIVVLSGMIHTVSGNTNRYHYEFNGLVDRFEAGIRLMKQQKASKLIFTRGHLPWTIGKSEGEVLAELAIDRGIDPQRIALTRKVENTSDEAEAVAEILTAKDRVILVTSAFHMPRASLMFLQQDIVVDPYPVDFLSGVDKFSVLDLVPSAGAMAGTTLVLRELLGRWYYHARKLYAESRL